MIYLIPAFSLSAKENAWTNINYISQSFFEVALGNEHNTSQNKNLRKWKSPIKIYVEHQTGDQQLHDQLLDAHIKQLKTITKFNISRVKDPSDANIFYYFTQQSSLKALVREKLGSSATKYIQGAVCLGSIKTQEENIITSAYIFIPVDQARMHGKLVTCIVEEITQALGLVRDSDLVFPSIFNDKSHNTLLTGLDEILLRLLSEQSVKAGMSKKELTPIIYKLLNTFESQGLIKTADYRVQQGKLYEMLGYKRKTTSN